jgi:very-short-patch-repair endonuclease
VRPRGDAEPPERRAARDLCRAGDAVDITLPHGRRRAHRGVAVHQRELRDDEWVLFDGLRTTTPLRTLHDLAEVLSVSELRMAINEALVKGLVEPGELQPVVGRRGAATMREALMQSRLTRSQVERLFLRLVRRAGVPLPDETNHQVAGCEVDALWTRERVVVEIDVVGTHGSGERFHADRRKDLLLRSHGFDVRRYSDHMLEHDALKVIADLTRALHFLK